MAEIPADIKARVARDFGLDAARVDQQLLEVMAVLEGYRLKEIPRTVRCVVQYAGGDWKRLEYALEIARRDYRDAIMFGEYERIEGQLVRVRNLSQPFEV